MQTTKKTSILFVCMGNICRSPTAEAVFRELAKQAGIEQDILIDSAGTHSYHIGSAPDPRSQAAAELRGYDLSNIRARRITLEDFLEFEYIVAMDAENMENLMQLCPAGYEQRLSLLLQHCESAVLDVPDPYYSGENGFDVVLDLIEDGTRGFLQVVLQELQHENKHNTK